VLSFLGAIFYSLCLVHAPIGGRIINLAVRLPATPPAQLASVLFAVVISLLAAWLFIEKPSAKLSKSIYSTRADGFLTTTGSRGT
jgi:peptidoglycan/LPS O-acetylase OafA/YrhL